MVTSVDINRFLKLMKDHPIIDVRSPDEFEVGHIPNAHSIPLMDNVERAIVGTIYKQNGKQAAILKGLDFAGPKLRDYIKQVKKITEEETLLLHCWRGGMRSNYLANLFSFYGLHVFVLEGGYKNYRKWCQQQFETKREWIVVGGMTGSGKTELLYALKNKGEQIIDLEKIAHHKGSAFGAIGQREAVSQEMFENELAFHLAQLDTTKCVWVEDESRMIGRKVVPQAIWEAIRKAKVAFIEIPFEKRLKRLVNTYGKFSKNELISSTERIGKRIGPEQCKYAIAAIKRGDFEEGFAASLRYYDKTYIFNLNKREKASVIPFAFETIDELNITEHLLHHKSKLQDGNY